MIRPPRHIALFLLLLVAVLTTTAQAGTPRHSRAVQTESGDPVVLVQQPGGELDRAARALNAPDLAAAVRRGDTPVILVGSAPLSTHAGDFALFVQLQSADLCGSAGCATSVYLRRDRRDWIKVLDSVSGPVALSRRSHDGMHDLIVNGTDRWIWNGAAYRDTMPAPPTDNLRQSIERFQAQHHTAHPP